MIIQHRNPQISEIVERAVARFLETWPLKLNFAIKESPSLLMYIGHYYIQQLHTQLVALRVEDLESLQVKKTDDGLIFKIDEPADPDFSDFLELLAYGKVADMFASSNAYISTVPYWQQLSIDLVN